MPWTKTSRRTWPPTPLPGAQGRELTGGPVASRAVRNRATPLAPNGLRPAALLSIGGGDGYELISWWSRGPACLARSAPASEVNSVVERGNRRFSACSALCRPAPRRGMWAVVVGDDPAHLAHHRLTSSAALSCAVESDIAEDVSMIRTISSSRLAIWRIAIRSLVPSRWRRPHGHASRGSRLQISIAASTMRRWTGRRHAPLLPAAAGVCGAHHWPTRARRAARQVRPRVHALATRNPSVSAK